MSRDKRTESFFPEQSSSMNPSPRKNRATMQDIATAAGISRMSVSLALRDSSRISAQTKKRVLQVADEMGYRTNPMVSALMKQLRFTKTRRASSALAFLTAYPTRNGWRLTGPGLAFYQGVQAHAEKLGFGLEIVWAKEPGMNGKQMSALLQARNIGGIIVAPMARACGHLTLNWNLFSSVILGYSSYRPNLHRTTSDTYQVTQLALRKLWHLGYRRIGLVLPSQVDTRTHYTFSAAYLRFQCSLKRAYQINPFMPSRHPINAQCLDWFHKEKPEAVLSVVPEVKGWLEKEAGMKAPRDYGFALLSVSNENRGLYAGIDQRLGKIGAAAVEMVSKQMFHGETGIPRIPQRVLIEGVWLDGPTVPASSSVAHQTD